MIPSAVLSTALALLAPSAGQATEEVGPLNVYLFARTVEQPQPESEKEPSEQEKKELKERKKAREKELKNKKKEAEQARKDLDKKLKKQYGKDRDEWPAEQQEEYRLAQEAVMMAQFESDYLMTGAFAKGQQKDLDDSVEDIMQAIQGKGIARKQKWISLVENRDQAHLLVEILDRRRPPLFTYQRLYRFVAVRISPVEAFRSNRLDDISPKEASRVKVRHAFRHEEPYWILECGAKDMWGNAAALVAGRLDMFIEDNRAVLMGDAPSQ